MSIFTQWTGFVQAVDFPVNRLDLFAEFLAFGLIQPFESIKTGVYEQGAEAITLTLARSLSSQYYHRSSWGAVVPKTQVWRKQRGAPIFKAPSQPVDHVKYINDLGLPRLKLTKFINHSCRHMNGVRV